MRSLTELAAEILADKKIVSWNGVRHVCQLLLAYADYNCAAADSKRGPISGEPTWREESVVGMLVELENVLEDCERAWRDFRSAEWPRGGFDVWLANDETFCAALARNARTLDDLRARHFGRAQGPDV